MHRDARQRAAQPPPPGGWPAGSPSPSSPQGLETRSRKRPRTDSASSPSADSNLGSVVDAQRAIRRVTADSYQGHTTSTYRTWLPGIDPRTAGTPAYTSYIAFAPPKVSLSPSSGKTTLTLWSICVRCGKLCGTMSRAFTSPPPRSPPRRPTEPARKARWYPKELQPPLLPPLSPPPHRFTLRKHLPPQPLRQERPQA
jgi:hypothetical protein